MKFQVGNTYGNGRPKGSKNKTHIETKDLVNRILFNEKEFIADWKEMDVRERMELRIKMAKFIMPEPKELATNDNDTDLPLFIDTQEDALRFLDMTENGE